MSIKETLTGKQRHRVQKKFGGYYLVLQVEVHKKGFGLDNAGGMIDTYDIDQKYWRDAKMEDIGGITLP